ncbi:MAG: hypothetical protein IT293_15950 [Deltaproteobacteria bacterium]|nr:hypothetical protein [Deltaproteobacteria bacterium]
MTQQSASTDPWTWIFLLSGLGNLVNGLWMLADPAHWYVTLPAAVPDFGPLNEHFVRDIGSAFAMLGLALVWGAARAEVRLPVLVLVTLFNALHALVHVWDTSRGLVGSEHWAIDFPVVYLPTIVLVVLTAMLVRHTEARR